MKILDMLKGDPTGAKDVIQRAQESNSEVVIEKYVRTHSAPSHYGCMPLPQIESGYRISIEDQDISAEKQVSIFDLSRYSEELLNERVNELEEYLEERNIEYETHI